MLQLLRTPLMRFQRFGPIDQQNRHLLQTFRSVLGTSCGEATRRSTAEGMSSNR